jgi:transcription antitermination factor NusG
MLPWYALHVASNTEGQVVDRLSDARIDSFFPHVMAKSRDKRRDITRKFFPGYVFANFDLAERTPVIRIPQVISILGCAHSPAIIPTSEVDAIRTMTLFATADVTACPYVAAGEQIRIMCGPLVGLEGYVIEMKGEALVVVSVTMFQRSIRTRVAIEDIQVIPRKAA